MSTNFKSGGDATATAEGYQANVDPTKMFNKGLDLGVANPDIQTDEDITLQGQNVQAGAFGGVGGGDNVAQGTKV
ncbi:MAG: hypothetical protein WA970_24235 [Gammaproteobacteria bacterium]|jgi:hypothetical protein